VETKLGKEEYNAADLEMTLRRYQELKAEFSSPALAEEEKPQLEEIPLKPTILEEEIKPLGKKAPVPEKVEEETAWDFEDVLIDEPILLSAEVKEEESEKKKVEESKLKKQMRIIRRDQKDEEEDLESIKTISVSESVERSIPKGGLRSFIDDKSRKGFIKKLFGGETEGYEHLLDKLEEADSWRVAKILIDNELFKRDVDPFSREAIKLVDIVYSRYYPEEGVGGKS
jgi:hypothetical protein